jgi:hypothetical protein
VQLTLKRSPSLNGTTLGKLYVNGVYEAETLEDQVRADGKVFGETAIPAGTYRVIINKSTRFNRMLPLILDVPGFLGIRIHPGNTDADTEGCILVGRYHVGASLEQSRVALELLQPKIAQALARHEDVFLTVENAPTTDALKA